MENIVFKHLLKIERNSKVMIVVNYVAEVILMVMFLRQ